MGEDKNEMPLDARLKKIDDLKKEAEIEESRLKSELEFTIDTTITQAVRVYGDKRPVEEIVKKVLEKANII